MSKTPTSPFKTSFNSAIKRGTPCFVAINNIAKRTGKSPTVVINSLFKANCINRQKFNGQWVCWPVNAVKSTSPNTKAAQWNMWQCFVDWCICSGTCTPAQLTNNKGSQQEFMAYCKKLFGKQFNTTTPGRKRTTATGRKNRNSSVNARNKSNYSFPKSRSTTRRTRRAA